jgi:hypothetical protein
MVSCQHSLQLQLTNTTRRFVTACVLLLLLAFSLGGVSLYVIRHNTGTGRLRSTTVVELWYGTVQYQYYKTREAYVYSKSQQNYTFSTFYLFVFPRNDLALTISLCFESSAPGIWLITVAQLDAIISWSIKYYCMTLDLDQMSL